MGQLYFLSHGGMYLTRQPRGSHPFVESLDKSAFLIEYGGVAQLGERAVRICKSDRSDGRELYLIRFTVKRKSRSEHKFVIRAALGIAIQSSLL